MKYRVPAILEFHTISQCKCTSSNNVLIIKIVYILKSVIYLKLKVNGVVYFICGT